jgi:pyruvate dehydrogenase E1 component alpha subunit
MSPEVAEDLYRDMYLGREFEEMCAQMYYRGKMFGFVHLYSGQEAVSTGVIRQLRKSDYICSTYRDHVHALSKGVPARGIMAELFGKKTGICRGQGGSMHMFSSEWGLLGGFAFIGEGIPVGLGAAFRSKYLRDALGDTENGDSVSVNFFGDGTANNGQFYECLNMASLFKLPCIFVVENNMWAIGMSHARATGLSDEKDAEPFIYKKGPAFGMPGVLVDGMDVRKVHEVAAEAIARARRGDGPTLIEAQTYRFRGHSLADPDELRPKAEKEKWQARDPIPTFRKWALEQGLLSDGRVKEIEAAVTAEVEDSVKFADESPKPEKGQLLENVFADPKGFGLDPSGKYRYEMPGFRSGDAAVS